jgi:hypothetical protein
MKYVPKLEELFKSSSLPTMELKTIIGDVIHDYPKVACCISMVAQDIFEILNETNEMLKGLSYKVKYLEERINHIEIYRR